jgi:hypothetical protein
LRPCGMRHAGASACRAATRRERSRGLCPAPSLASLADDIEEGS